MGNKRKGRQNHDANVSAKVSRIGAGGRERASVLEYLPLLPLLVIVGIVPLIVFLKPTPVPPDYRQFWVTNYVFDFFSFYKARIIVVCAGIILLLAFVFRHLGRLWYKKDALFIPLGIYAIMITASTALSEHPSIALGGFFERSEGMWVLLAYVVLLVGTYLFVNTDKQAWLILTAGAVTLCVICTLGAFQFFGLDFFGSMVGRRLILPAQYQHLAPVLSANFRPHTIYATLYNPNNVANMMAIVFPLTATCLVLARRWQLQAVSGVLAWLSCLMLIGSNGRGAWIAALLALSLLFVVSTAWGRTRGWKWPVALTLAATVGFSALDHTAGGALGIRAAGIWSEAVGIWSRSGQQYVGCKAIVLPTDGGATSAAQEELAERLIRRYGDVASGRGYIWIRSLQMAGDTLLLGRGPDTFALYFPNTDPYKVCVQAQTFFDKPHNMYVQMWLNLGGIATLAFLAMAIMHAARTHGILKRADKGSDLYVLAVGLYVGWVGYLLAGFFYDSAVHVAPVFWVMFGLGMAMNKAIEAEHPHNGPGSIRIRVLTACEQKCGISNKPLPASPCRVRSQEVTPLQIPP